MVVGQQTHYPRLSPFDTQNPAGLHFPTPPQVRPILAFVTAKKISLALFMNFVG